MGNTQSEELSAVVVYPYAPDRHPDNEADEFTKLNGNCLEERGQSSERKSEERKSEKRKLKEHTMSKLLEISCLRFYASRSDRLQFS